MAPSVVSGSDVISSSGLLALLSSFFSPRHFCPPPFRRKAEGHCFWFSVVRGA